MRFNKIYFLITHGKKVVTLIRTISDETVLMRGHKIHIKWRNMENFPCYPFLYRALHESVNSRQSPFVSVYSSGYTNVHVSNKGAYQIAQKCRLVLVFAFCICSIHPFCVMGVISCRLIKKWTIFSSPGRSPGRAIVPPLALASALASALAKC